ncbi:MAG: carboxylate-amine ligase [Rhizobiales bacterium]|nr:carboxylate-amine ligase [Hyphomicrobiales bacterium]
MRLPEPSFTIGIEEEYLLVDKESRDLAADPPKELMQDCAAALGDHVTPEFLRCQIEIGTPVCSTLQEARQQLVHLRKTIAEISGKYGLAPLAVSTHPFAVWSDQHPTEKDRYTMLAKDLQVVVRRMVICGMHVHVAIENESLRNDLFGQLTYFLPHLLALSTSSPFWQGRVSGLKSYRLAIFDELPRTGLPEQFDSYGEFQRTVSTLISAGVIEDASKIWWDLRPSSKFPTLEMRVTDVCTLIDDTISVAALYRCLARMLWRLRGQNQRWRTYSRFLVMENRWRAQRYGVKEGLVDFGMGEIVPFADLTDELIALVAEDAEFFGCVEEVNHARTIVKRGTSADRQLATFNEAIAANATQSEALCLVVDQLIAETLQGV